MADDKSIIPAISRAFESEKVDIAQRLRALADAIDAGVVTAKVVHVEHFANSLPGVNLTVEVRPKY